MNIFLRLEKRNVTGMMLLEIGLSAGWGKIASTWKNNIKVKMQPEAKSLQDISVASNIPAFSLMELWNSQQFPALSVSSIKLLTYALIRGPKQLYQRNNTACLLECRISATFTHRIHRDTVRYLIATHSCSLSLLCAYSHTQIPTKDSSKFPLISQYVWARSMALCSIFRGWLAVLFS